MQVHRTQPGGFTLVELLVVSGIIAVLVSMLLPALNKGRVHAQTLKCASNLKQIGIGFAMYRSDWHNYLPPVDAYASHVPAGKPWRFTKDYMMYSAIGPYLGKPAVKIGGAYWWGAIQYNPNKDAKVGGPGPDFTTDPPKNAIRGTVWECPDPKTTGYDYPSMHGYAESRYLSEPATVENTAYPRPFGKVRHASTAIQVADAYYDGSAIGKGQVKNLDDAEKVKLGTSRKFDLYRHNRDRGANILFADGHVEYRDRDDVRKNLTYYPADKLSSDNFRLP